MTDTELTRNNYVISKKEICAILGLKARRIEQLTEENALVRVGRGKYDLPLSIEKYIDFEVGKSKPKEGELDNNVETALWTRERRKKTELEVKIIKGELHRSVDVERIMNDMLSAFRARLLSMPSKLAPQLLMIEDISIVKAKIKEAIIEAMNELKDYDPNVFFDTSRDKMFIEEEEESSEPDDGSL